MEPLFVVNFQKQFLDFCSKKYLRNFQQFLPCSNLNMMQNCLYNNKCWVVPIVALWLSYWWIINLAKARTKRGCALINFLLDLGIGLVGKKFCLPLLNAPILLETVTYADGYRPCGKKKTIIHAFCECPFSRSKCNIWKEVVSPLNGWKKNVFWQRRHVVGTAKMQK